MHEAVPAYVETTGLTHSYDDDTLALDGLDLRLTPGVTALVGANGAGKSTLISVLATVLEPTSGSVTYGEEVWPLVSGAQLRKLRRRIGLAPQNVSFLARSRVRDLLEYAAWLRDVPATDRTSAANEALAAVDLTSVAEQRVGQLSGGMRQRLNIAQALVHTPNLLMLDEPMEGLDPEQRVRVREIIATAATRGAVLVSSHVMGDLIPIATKVIMLDAGRVVFSDTPAALRTIGETIVAPDSGISAYEAAFLKLRGSGS